jgi:hypothetical protein
MDDPFDFELSLAVSVAPANAAVVNSERAAAKIIFFMVYSFFPFGTDHSLPPHRWEASQSAALFCDAILLFRDTKHRGIDAYTALSPGIRACPARRQEPAGAHLGQLSRLRPRGPAFGPPVSTVRLGRLGAVEICAKIKAKHPDILERGPEGLHRFLVGGEDLRQALFDLPGVRPGSGGLGQEEACQGQGPGAEAAGGRAVAMRREFAAWRHRTMIRLIRLAITSNYPANSTICGRFAARRGSAISFWPRRNAGDGGARLQSVDGPD